MVTATPAIGALALEPAAALPREHHCELDGQVELVDTPQPWGGTRPIWEIDLNGTCTDSAGEVSTLNVQAVDQNVYPSEPPCVAGHGMYRTFHVFVQLTRTYPSGESTVKYQYWSDFGVTPGNAHAFKISRAFLFVSGNYIVDDEIGHGLVLTRVFLACPGDPHAEVTLDFD